MSEKIQDSEIVLNEVDTAFPATDGAQSQHLDSSAAEQSAETEHADSVSSPAFESVSLNGFHNLRLIASGASGSVYSAIRNSDNRTVAVKIFQKELTPSSDSIRRFEHEVATLTKLSHPNIVKILGSGSTDSGESYIVMEKVEGDSLRKILDRTGEFDPKHAVIVVREVCRALSAAHENGIIHRDLKPNNIILDANNIAKVVDFGVAKAVGSSTDTITQYGAIIGTPAYMSPEQCLGKIIDARSDVYSLGCTLYELLTNCKAFEAETAMAALAKQISPDRSFLKCKLDEKKIPFELQEIVLRCLNRDPEMRFNSAAALDHELSAYLLQIPKSKNSNEPEASKWVQILTCTFCLIAVLVIFETALWNARLKMEATPSNPIPPPAPSRRSTASAGAPITIDVKNRITGQIIYSESAPDLTLAKALQNATNKGISLLQADLPNAKLLQSNLRGVDLRSADLSNADFTQAKLTDVKLDGAIMTKAKMIQVTLTRCSLRDARMSSSNMTQLHGPYTVLAGTDLSNSDMTQAKLMNSDLRGVNFTGADTMQAEFFGSDITNANFSLPKGNVKPDLQGCMSNGVRVR